MRPPGDRLELAFPAPPEGRTLLVGAPADLPSGRFDSARSVAVQTDAAAHAALMRRGFAVETAVPEGHFDGAVVFLPRARAAARARIAAAAATLAPRAELWVDGQKTDGVEAMLRELRGLGPVGEILTRAHGKLFAVTVPEGDWLPADWAAVTREVAPGFVTRPGVFSADGPDPGSMLLAAALPPRMPSRVVDLGAGWGWLAAQVLAREGVTELHLVESDHDALACARENIRDPRARFHWADATGFRLPEPVNGVVMNPPFHEGRAATPRLGAAFIAAAAGMLTQAGRLWMVANRHLPYEAELGRHFARVEEFGGDSRYKLLTATGAKRRR
ncbi:class I SAM-dependent methyltransferase [Paracoccus sp. S-4012]|uniref:class I SAM-dependent methyltransferase n=1 Tax=Paracoccus sp. S-4012 TaxID=2665648 RepID=UPI00351ABA36